MKAVRWILGITGVVVLLAVAAVLIAMLLINPDHYKGEIESAVRRETGRPFVLQGHLQITWFPWLGVRAGAARLGNPAGAAGPDLLDWQSAELRVRLLPLLLHRRLEVGRIRVVGADIHLRRGPHGEGSWDDLIARMRSARTTNTARADEGRRSDSSAAWPVVLAGLDLEESSLDYSDERSREHVSLTGWRLSVGPWRSAQPLSVSTSFVLHVDALGNPGSPAAGALRLPPAGVPVSLDVPRLRVEASEKRPLEVVAPSWSFRVADAKLEGAVDAGMDADGRPTASGSVRGAVPSVRGLAHALGVALPVPKDPAALEGLSVSAGWSYREGALDIKPLTAKLDSTTISGWVAYAPVSAWTFALRADQVDLGRYLTQPSKEHKPLELPQSALRALHAQGTLELARAQIDGTELQDVRLQVQ